MASVKLKLFQFLQQTYATNGICPSESHCNFKKLNHKNLFAFLAMVQFGISSLAYMAFQADSIGQRADSLYMVVTEVTCVTLLAYNIMNIDNILKLIANCETFIEKSN